MIKKKKKTNLPKSGFATRSIHSGQSPDPSTGAIMTPIYASSTYVQDSPGVHKGYEYSRTSNPTRYAYEQCVSDLEGGNNAFAFSSGMAAADAVLSLLKPGDTVLAIDDLYGGTRRLFEKIRSVTSHIKFIYSDLSNINLFNQIDLNDVNMIWIETPTNPMLKLVDLKSICKKIKEKNILTVVDNTFCSPFIQRPIEFGVDIVVHSATKFLNGHSDMVGGLVICKKEKDSERIAYIQNAVGAIQGPFDAYLALRGLKTLSIRMERHCFNALKIAEFLEQNKYIKNVFYPGLKSHPNYELAKNQMDGFGGIVTCIVNGGVEAARTLLETCQIFQLAESLGGVESLIEHPGIMTHASVPKNVREKLGIEDGLIRLSVGIEDIGDLLDDLNRGLDAIERL